MINFIKLWFLCFYRYSGELSDFGTQLDDIASFIWENVFILIFLTFILLLYKYIKI